MYNLTRRPRPMALYGYRLKDMTEQFDAIAAEIRERILAVGLLI